MRTSDNEWGFYSAEQQADDEKILEAYRREWSAWNWFLSKTDSRPAAHTTRRREATKKRADAADMIQTMEDLIRVETEAREERISR